MYGPPASSVGYSLLTVILLTVPFEFLGLSSSSAASDPMLMNFPPLVHLVLTALSHPLGISAHLQILRGNSLMPSKTPFRSSPSPKSHLYLNGSQPNLLRS